VSYKVLTEVPIPMRDGVELSTNIWLPDATGPVPAVMVRTPYGKNLMGTYIPPTPNMIELVSQGYAVVIQDCRGAYASGGVFVPHINESQDGFDTIEWLIAQPWCDGNIGTFGSSYLGMVQWSLARTGHNALKAIAPAMTTGDPHRSPWYSPGGAMSLDIVLIWGALMSLQGAIRAQQRGQRNEQDVAALSALIGNWEPLFAETPVRNHPLIEKYVPWMIQTAIDNPDRNDMWDELSSINKVTSITTPALHIAGWYDLFLYENLYGYRVMQASAATEEARAGQRLIIGPWGHSANGYLAMYRDRIFGLAATAESAQLGAAHVAFFDRYLKDKHDALESSAPVRLFVMGLDQWRDEQAWPLPDTRYVEYFLVGDGPANSAKGAGRLSLEPAEEARIDTYLYDPRRPVPTLGGTRVLLGGWDGAADQRIVHSRDDVLIFSTDALERAVEVTGPVTATLYVSSSAIDTDFTAKLVDVFPDGRAIILCDGIQRMRYRNSSTDPEFMTPEAVYEITIDLVATSNLFLPGHRILVEISSSNFPRYDRNSNTGGFIAGERLEDMVAAVNSMRRGGDYPSRVTLPLIER
jgi:putative CocE/NonD family hydrolase